MATECFQYHRPLLPLLMASYRCALFPLLVLGAQSTALLSFFACQCLLRVGSWPSITYSRTCAIFNFNDDWSILFRCKRSRVLRKLPINLIRNLATYPFGHWVIIHSGICLYSKTHIVLFDHHGCET